MGVRLVLALTLVCSLVVPSRADREVARVQAQLTRVLAELRATDTTALAPDQQRNRRAALATLETYTHRGVFPRRSGNPYGALRPRFVDDRGVRCAVGELVAMSGHPELTAAIARDHEYAYVRDIASPALLAWATTHGFTVDELARIQPSYSAVPTEGATRRMLADAKDEITLACAAEHAPIATLAIHVVGTKHGNAIVSTKSTDPFARCFVTRASQVERGGGAYMGSPEPYDFDLNLAITPPQRLLDARLATISDIGDCTPRPGPIPRGVVLEVTSDEHGLVVHAALTPHNAEVEVCVESSMARRLYDYRTGVWQLHGTRRFALPSPFDARQFHELLKMHVPNIATDCYPAGATLTHVKLSVAAKADDTKLAIRVDTADTSFATCVADKLQTSLRDALSVIRNGEHYFRIDRDVSDSVDVPVQTPAARQKRTDELSKQFHEHVH